MLSNKAWSNSVRLVVAMATAATASPFATDVLHYEPGEGAPSAYRAPQSALGEPSRFIADESWPGVVSIFNPPWLSTQIVSMGRGGSLTVRFDEPITDAPNHLFGIDLIVFGNCFFVDAAYPAGQFGQSASVYGMGAGRIEVSENGVDFYAIPDVLGDQLFPTQGYTDVGPQDSTPGASPTDFRRPVNPALTLSDFDGLSYQQAMALYDGSGGGTPIDLAHAVDAAGSPAGLTQARYVRVSHVGEEGTTEIDAFAVVPEPSIGLMLLAGLGSLAFRGRASRQGGC